MSLAIMNRITKPTKFELQYECYENNFLMYPINGDNEGSTESDHHADQLLQEICDFAREYDNLNNQRAQGIEEQQVQQPVFGEAEVGHYTWKQTCSRAFAIGQSCLVRNISFFITNSIFKILSTAFIISITFIFFSNICINNDLQNYLNQIFTMTFRDI
jgi:hypothetical protein